MNIPNTLKIGSREISVRIMPIDPAFLGLYLPDKLEIQLSSSIQSRSLLEEVFFHELFHAVGDYVRMEMSIRDEMEEVAESEGEEIPSNSFSLEERITEAMSKTLLQVLKDNNLMIQ